MKKIRLIAGLCLLTGIAAGTVLFMKKDNVKIDSDGYIGRSSISVTDGRMIPEALLSLGRLSDPQVSPDGKHILYGVSYTSIEENRSVRNLFICNIDGTGNQQLTTSGKSISNARWYNDGSGIYFLMGGQMWSAHIDEKDGRWELTDLYKMTEIPGGITEFKMSPDQNFIMYSSYVKSSVKAPSDCYKDLDKATAYTTDDLMYRHWDHTVMEIPHTFVVMRQSKSGPITEGTDILAGEDGLYELPTEPFGGLEQLSWSPDSRFIAYSCRKLVGKRYAFSTNTEIYIYNVYTAETEMIEMGGGYDTDPVWSPDGSKLCWISMERDGYEADKQRLIVAEVTIPETIDEMPEISKIQDITVDFKYNVSSPVWTSDSKGIYFSALAEGIQGIFKAYEESESWEIVRITGEDLWYDFGSPFHVSENDGTLTLYTTWCSMDFPTELVAVRCSGDETDYTQITDENGHILSQLAPHETEARYVKFEVVQTVGDRCGNSEYANAPVCLGELTVLKGNKSMRK